MSKQIKKHKRKEGLLQRRRCRKRHEAKEDKRTEEVPYGFTFSTIRAQLKESEKDWSGELVIVKNENLVKVVKSTEYGAHKGRRSYGEAN